MSHPSRGQRAAVVDRRGKTTAAVHPRGSDAGGDSRYSTSLDKAVAILNAMESAGAPLGAQELADRLHVERGTAYRAAQALLFHGWLRQDAVSKKYSPSLRLFELGALALDGLDVRAVARPAMRRLSADTGESTGLAVLDGPDIVHIERVEGTLEVRSHTPIGKRSPAHAGAMGKVLLANLSPAERRAVLRPALAAFTDRTITDRAQLTRELEAARERGYALDAGERTPDSCGIAAPVFSRTGDCVAALCIYVPSHRFQPDRVGELVDQVIAAAARVSRDLGAPV